MLLLELLPAIAIASIAILAALHAAGAGIAAAFRSRVSLGLFAPLGALAVPIMILLAWQMPPAGRGWLVSGVVIVLAAVGTVIAARRGRRGEAISTALALLLAVAGRFATSSDALWRAHGASGGNGDLPYYDILARLLIDYGVGEPGWIEGVDLRERLLGIWGDGGYTGAAGVAFGALLLGVATASAALPVLIALCGASALGLSVLVRRAVNIPASAALIAAVAGVGGAATVYLVSNSFVLMISAMAVLPLLFWTISAGRTIRTRRDRVAAGVLAAASTAYLLVAYPTMSLGYILMALALAIWFGWRRWGGDRLPILRRLVPSTDARPIVRSARLVTISIAVAVVLCTGRLVQVAVNAPRTTDPDGGWRLYVARPTFLFGEESDARWTLVDVFLVVCAVVAILVLFLRGRRGGRMAIVAPILVGLALTSLFSIVNGPSAYNAWKPSYFIAPFVIAAALSGGFVAIARLRLRPLAWVAFVASAGMLLAGTVVAIRLDRINFDRPNLEELQAAIASYGPEESLVVALSPWDQLWAAYYAPADVTVLVPSVAVDFAATGIDSPRRVLSYADPNALCPLHTFANAAASPATLNYTIWSIPRGEAITCR